MATTVNTQRKSQTIRTTYAEQCDIIMASKLRGDSGVTYVSEHWLLSVVINYLASYF